MFYYLVSFYAKDISFVIREEDFAAIASEITSQRCSLVVVSYLSKDELPDHFILLTPHC